MVPIYSLYTMYKECDTVFCLLYKAEQGPSTPEEAIQHLFNCCNQALSLKHISGQNMTFVAKYCQFIDYLPYTKCLRMPLDSTRLCIVYPHLRKPSNLFPTDSRVITSTWLISGWKMTFAAKWCQFIEYLPYTKRLLLSFWSPLGFALSIHTWSIHPTSSQLLQESKPGSSSQTCK